MTRTRQGWTKIASGGRGSKVGVYKHEQSGWTVSHCGHPTANWPYYLTAPKEHELAGLCIVSFNGKGFRLLVAAQTAVELVHAGQVEATTRRCVQGVGRVLLDAAGEPIIDDEPADRD
jgi:hypothetical protein